VAVRKPTRPLESTKIELVAAPAVRVNGVSPPVESSIENLLAPPEFWSLARIRQSRLGKPAEVEVSSKWMRLVFSLSRMLSAP
jgi:hypothetical protein